MAPPRRIDLRMKRDTLLTSPFFRPMRPEELDGILALSTELRVAKGASIFGKGDPGASMMAVLAGRVRIGNVSPDGKEVTLNVIGQGEIFGEIALLDGKPRSADATALEDSVLMVIERRHFMPFLLRHTSLALEEIALFDLPVRLARLLVKLAADYGRPVEGGTRIDLKLSQRDLATLVASTRESVNKQLRLWTRDGVLDQQEGYMVLRAPAALHALVS